MNKLATKAEVCKDNMDIVAKEKTIDLTYKILNILKSTKISNLRASQHDLTEIILSIRRDENYRFKSELERLLYEQEVKLKNKLELEKIIEDNLIELRRHFIIMEDNYCFMDFSDRSLEQVMEYLISKNRHNLLFEKKYYDLRDELKYLLKNEYKKYMKTLSESSTNLMLPIVKRDSEEFLNQNEEIKYQEKNELSNFKLF